MNKPQLINSSKAPDAVGPYSQALATDNLVYTSGQLPLKNGKMPENVSEQAAQCLENVKAVLEEAGSGMDKVLKSTVYLADINDFAAMNEVYAKYFSKPFPARSCFAVKALPLGAKVEIEVVAMRQV